MADGTHRIRLIVGLGNPDSKYEGTRHNAGFMFAERLLTKLPRSFQRIHGFQSYYWKGTYAGAPLIVQTPLTYMNLSGEAVAPLMRSEGIAPDEVLAVHDDMDIPLGRIRIRKGGGSARHNGIKSLIEQIGSEGFHRMRIGVGHAESRGDVIDYVLSEFSEEERKVFDRARRSRGSRRPDPEARHRNGNESIQSARFQRGRRQPTEQNNNRNVC